MIYFMSCLILFFFIFVVNVPNRNKPIIIFAKRLRGTKILELSLFNVTFYVLILSVVFRTKNSEVDINY